MPVAGTTSPEAGVPAASASVASAPAADSPPSPSPESPTPAAESTPASSLLGAAKPESTEPAAAAPDSEAPVAADAPAEPLPLPAYEPFAIPDGVTIDVGKINEFQTLLGTTENRLAQTPAEAHAAMQELGQQLLATHIQALQDIEAQQAQLQKESWQRLREEKVAELEGDPELGGGRIDATTAHCQAMIAQFGSSVGEQHANNLRQKLIAAGLDNDVDVVRYVNWAAGFVIEKPRMVAATGIRGPQPMSRSQRLYRNSIPPNGAA